MLHATKVFSLVLFTIAAIFLIEEEWLLTIIKLLNHADHVET